MQTPANNQRQFVVPQTPEPLTAPQRTIQVPNEACFAAIQNAADLSEESKRHYAGCLTRLVVGGAGRKGSAPTPAMIPGSSLLWCATHPEQCCQLLQRSLNAQGRLNPRAIHNYTASLRSVMAHHPELAKLTAVRERWKRIADQLVVTPLTAEAKLNKPTERQAAGIVTYPEIAAKFKELELGSKESLLVGLVGLADEQMLPQRRDFGAVRLYIGCEPPPDKIASGNYLVLRRDATSGSLAGEIILNQYKTAKTYGQKRMELPLPYIQTLLASLDQNPRQYLFCMEETKRVAANTPYCDNSFGKWANNTLKQLFGRPLTLSGVRHAFISSMHCSKYWAGMSDAQREQIATQMGHSFSTACKYRWVGVR